MRLAAYNVENLFDRAKVMNGANWAEGREVLTQHAELNRLLGQEAYAEPARRRMSKLMIDLGLEQSDTGPYVILRRNRGKLLKRPKNGGIEIIAGGRADWAGSLELRDEPITELAMQNTARVIADVNADVLAVIEAENRPVLSEFNRLVLPSAGGDIYRHVMLIDGNDSRGIDVGLMTRDAYPIGPMRSHVDDCTADNVRIFSRDCPEFEVATPSGEQLLVLVNHFKSKGYGSKAASDERRRLQAKRVAEIYRERVEAGARYVAIVGDLNDTPSSDPLAPLLGDTDLRDISDHGRFDDGGYPGTYGASGLGNKIDYLLLSPELFAIVRGGGVWRKGVWPGVRPRKWEVYDSLERPEDAASDHAALWADLDL